MKKYVSGIIPKTAKQILILMMMVCWSHAITANVIDIGLFESSTPGQIDVKIRPDFIVNPKLSFTAIFYTIRWADPTMEISLISVAPYNIAAHQNPVFHNGFYYQRFFSFMNQPAGSEILPGEERIISSFTITGSEDACFELIVDEWTGANFWDYYIELQGSNRTGIIYQPIAPIIGFTITCPANITTDNDPGRCGAAVTNTLPFSNHPDATIAQLEGLPSGAFFPLGTTVNTYQATNQDESITCSFNVTVLDTEAPSVSCIKSQSRVTDPDQCHYTVQGAEFDPLLFNDNCTGNDDLLVTNSFNGQETLEGALLPAGETTIVWLVEDEAGNTTQCSFTITVEQMYLFAVAFVGGGSATVNGNPYTEPLALAAGVNLTLEAVAGEGYQFVGWTDGDGTEVSGETVYSFPMPTADVSLTANFTEIEYSVSVAINPAKTTDIHTADEMPDFSIYPNPTRDRFTLEMHGLAPSAVVAVEVFGMRGERILQQEVSAEEPHVFSLSSHRPGIYLIRVSDEMLIGIRRIVKR